MILINDFQKFYATLMDLKESQIQYKLFGNMEESYLGALTFPKFLQTTYCKLN